MGNLSQKRLSYLPKAIVHTKLQAGIQTQIFLYFVHKNKNKKDTGAFKKDTTTPTCLGPPLKTKRNIVDHQASPTNVAPVSQPM